eukprot:GHRR01024364.1.p1 GENE.GHRR01024364.1~~GHRR01024364.1.p1  ORF type:complete len:184 (+),score=77.85 GHRR01024364.1:525-1076(+)
MVTLSLQVCDAIELSRKTLSKIQQNLGWAFCYNLVGIPLAAGALLPKHGIALTPSISGALTGLSSLAVMANSLMLQLEVRGMRNGLATAAAATGVVPAAIPAVAARPIAAAVGVLAGNTSSVLKTEQGLQLQQHQQQQHRQQRLDSRGSASVSGFSATGMTATPAAAIVTTAAEPARAAAGET